MSWLIQQNLGIHNSGRANTFSIMTLYIGYVCTAVSVIGHIPFHQQKTPQMTEQNYLQNIIDAAIYMKPCSAVSLADDEIVLFVATWYRQFKISPHDLGKHARCDDVVHILMVKFETYQIQMGIMISDFMFCTYKLWTP
jgi:hypothetical protein